MELHLSPQNSSSSTSHLLRAPPPTHLSISPLPLSPLSTKPSPPMESLNGNHPHQLGVSMIQLVAMFQTERQTNNSYSYSFLRTKNCPKLNGDGGFFWDAVAHDRARHPRIFSGIVNFPIFGNPDPHSLGINI